MSASDSTHRVHYTGLVTQQRRLRHLTSLSARNIVSDGARKDNESLMETYFTLHALPSLETVYTSEKIHNSLNPTWRSFDLQMSCPNLDTSKSIILVRVWGGHSSECSLVIEWLVDLRGLCYLGWQIHKDGVRYQPNSIIFGMFQGFYGAPDNLLDPRSIHNEFRSSIEVEQSSSMLSYRIFTLGRLHTTQRAIRQTEASVSKVRSSIVEKLTQVQRKTQLHSEREALKLRLGILKYELEQQEELLSAECKKCTVSRDGIDNKVQDSSIRKETLKTDIEELGQQSQVYLEKKEQLRKTFAKLSARKTTLLGELSDIYPVVELQNHEHTILGIRLPNAERYSGIDDMVVSTGLGHTCHLILMMSQILRLPLRYPMVHYGSRSLVRDHITESLAEKDRDFPLYSRGKERFQFNYALYLLNRNIAQLRFAMGLQTADLRATLPNLKSLLELKWGIRNNTTTMIYRDPRNLHQSVQSDSAMHQQQQQQHGLAALGNVTVPQGVAPYPVQAPPVYSQVEPTHAPQLQEVEPPPYQVEVPDDPPPSPCVDQNSPFEDLSAEAQTETLRPSSPIPIPSVDAAARVILESKHDKLRDSDNGSGLVITAVIETQGLEDSAQSTETLRPSVISRERGDVWVAEFDEEEMSRGPTPKAPSSESLDHDSVHSGQHQDLLTSALLSRGATPKAPSSQSLDHDSVHSGQHQDLLTSALENHESPLSFTSEDNSLRIAAETTGAETAKECSVLPEFAPSSELGTPELLLDNQKPDSVVEVPMEKPEMAASSNTNNHHSSENNNKSLLPANPSESESFQPLSGTSTNESNLSAPNSANDITSSSVCENSERQTATTNPNHTVLTANPTHKDNVLPRPSSAIRIPPMQYEDATYASDTDDKYQFVDLGSRAEALSRQESFSSFRKVSTSPSKGRKSGKV